MEKMTYKNALAIAIESVSDVEVKEKLIALSESLVRKSSNGSRKPSKVQIENEGHKNAIIDLLSDGTARSITQITKAIPSFAEFSNQKVSALVRQLKDSGVINRTEEKGKALFVIAK